MSLIADILLVAASLGLAIYCVVLSRRLARFTDLEKGVGGAVAVLSAQVDDLTRALKTARETAQSSAQVLDATTARAEDVARRLELHVAAMHDLPPQPQAQPQPRPQARPEPQEAAFERAAAPGPVPDTSLQTAKAVKDDDAAPAFAHALSFGARHGAPAEPKDEAPAPANGAPSLFAHRRAQPGGLG